MTKAEAVHELQTCKWLDAACRNIGKSDWEELRQEFWVQTLEAPESRFTKIRDLRFYCVRVLLNIRSNNGKGVVHDSLNVAAVTAHEYDPYLDRCHLLKSAILARLPMYDRVLFQLHEKGFSKKKIHRETGIHHKEVGDTINRVSQLIKDAVQLL